MSFKQQAIDIVSRVDTAWREMITKEEGRSPGIPRNYLYASQYHPCERHMYYDCVRPDMRVPFSVDALARMRGGKDKERDLINIQLSRAGQYATPPFTVENGQERVPILGRNGKIVISGKKEGDLVFGRTDPRVPFELKNWSENTIQNIETFDDLFRSQFSWIRAGAMQFLTYLYGSNAEMGIFILALRGIPKLLPVAFQDYLGETERFIATAERVQEHIEAGVEPDYIEDQTVCKRCDFFGTICQPDTDYSGMRMITDEEFIQDVSRLQELEHRLSDEEWSEYNKLDKQVKARLRGVESAIIGNFVMSGKWGKLVKYDIPDDVKAQYKQEDPKGKFFVQIKPLDLRAAVEEAQKKKP